MPRISFLGIPLATTGEYSLPVFHASCSTNCLNHFLFYTPIFKLTALVSSSTMSRNARSTAESSYRRIVSLPRNILGGISRAMDQGIGLLRIRPRRNNYNNNNNNNIPFQHMHLQEAPQQPEEYLFLDSFEQQFGTMHPFFYACSYIDALKIAKDEGKFIFLYLHSPEHPFTSSFCRETLCNSELVVQFLDANFVCWGGLANRGEGYQLCSSLKVTSFPFCALVAPATEDSIAVLQQLEGPITPSELVEIMQKTLEEQGMAFGIGNSKKEEKRREEKRLREEQNAAYIAALQIDQEKEKLRTSNSLNSEEKVEQKPIQQNGKGKEASKAERSGHKESSIGKGNAQITQILIRFPNGERKEDSFLGSDKIQDIFKLIDSLNLPGIENYRLVSNFPRKVYGKDQMGMSLKDAGLHPKATFFLELL